MADAKPRGPFGSVDLDLEIEDEPPPHSQGFGELDWDIAEPSDPAPPPESTSRASIHDDATRVVKGDALSMLTRSQPPPAAPHAADEPAGGGATRMASVDENLLAAARTGETMPPPSIPSKSGVATRDDVARMRELYAKGEAEAALAVAASLTSSPPVGPAIHYAADHPDASIAVEVGEEMEIDISLPGTPAPKSVRYDARVEIDDSPPPPSQRPKLPPNRPSNRPLTAPPPSASPSAGLTLTQRQSIPRVVKTPAEIASMPMDHRGGFLLGFIDGISTLEEILDICAMPGPEALDLVVQLAQLGVIEFD